MKTTATTMFERASTRFFSGLFGTRLVFVLSPILLLLGSSPETGAYTNVELAFSVLASLGASCCASILVSNAHRAVDLPLFNVSQSLRLPAPPELTTDERPEARERLLPVVVPSLVLPTLISGLGGWVGVVVRAPRATARPSVA